MIGMVKKVLTIAVGMIVLVVYVFFDYLSFCDRSAPILMYHGVGNENLYTWGNMLIKPEIFDVQLQFLRAKGYNIVSVEELSDKLRKNESVKKVIALTFDDGYVNNFVYAFPILKKNNATATIYVISNALGKEGYLNDCHIQEMLSAGMKIGSHTMSHSKLTDIDKELLRKELAGSKMLLGQRYENYIVESISYPYGAFNDIVLEECITAGYKEGVSGVYGVNTCDTFNEIPYTLNRIGVYGGVGIDEFWYNIERAYLVGYLKYRGIDIGAIRSFLKETENSFLQIFS